MALALFACTVSPVDFSEKTCPCDQGFVCIMDRCVSPGDASTIDAGTIEGLVAHYPLDDVPASAAVDPMGGGPRLRCGVEGLCPTSVEGRIGRAFAFAGGDEIFMEGVDDGRLVTPTGFTAAVYVRPAAITRAAAFAKLRDSTVAGAIGWALEIDAAGRVGFAVGNDSDGESRVWSEPFTVATGQWAHLAGTWDGVAIRLFVDGEEVAAGSGMADASRGDLLIGGNAGNVSLLPWTGDVDDARLYNRELDLEEIGRLSGL
jgi:beta-galactosidase